MPPQLTVKEQRDARRAAKVAELKRKEAARRRNRIIGFVIGGVAVVAIVALVITLVVTSAPKTPTGSASGSIKGLKTWTNLPANHVDGTKVDYETTYGMNPPAGGNHWSVWLNCGVYDQPQENENAVHDLEHGAVWITYDPDKVSKAKVTAMVKTLPDTYITVSPYPGLPAPVVASAWGYQVKLTGTTDPRLAKFVAKYWRSSNAPEPTSPCTGGLDGPGKVS